MRCVFTSPRLENVEAVAKLLGDAGIEVRIKQDRSYKGKRRRPFSYRENPAKLEPDPEVWVIKAEDQPRARQMLRDEGLIDSTRPDVARKAFLPSNAAVGAPRGRDRRAAIVMRVRLLLLAIIVLLTMLTLSGILHR